MPFSKRHSLKRKVQGFALFGLVTILLTLAIFHGQQQRKELGTLSQHVKIGRTLLGVESNERHDNKTVKYASSEFPGYLFKMDELRKGAFVIHILVSLYMFIGLAICCDGYLVPSLELISHKLNLQPDVAGASLLAIGGSAPELFVSIIGVFITKGDVGIGTILGSAVFNALFVNGLCGVVARTVLVLSYWPVSRDTICYGISVVCLAFVVYDRKVNWKEGLVLVTLYPLYLLLMIFNKPIEKTVYRYIGDQKSLAKRFGNISKPREESEYYENDRLIDSDVEDTTKAEILPSETTDSDDLDLDPPENFWEVPSGCRSRLLWLLTLPINFMLTITIPDVRRERFRIFAVITFANSIIWIGLFSYVLLWMVTIIGETLGIPDTVMGLSFVAFGSSVPDCLSSIIVARKGYGNMAVSHSFGSNVFDILLCLGLPWLFNTLIFDPDSTIEVKSSGMFLSCIILLFVMIIIFVLFIYNKFVLGKRLGYIMIFLYCMFLIVAVSIELVNFFHPELSGVFFNRNTF